MDDFPASGILVRKGIAIVAMASTMSKLNSDRGAERGEFA
jgi:hypothetical protein